MVPELEVHAIVSGRAVAWELIEVSEPALLPLVPDFDWGAEFIESARSLPVLTLVAKRAA